MLEGVVQAAWGEQGSVPPASFRRPVMAIYERYVEREGELFVVLMQTRGTGEAPVTLYSGTDRPWTWRHLGR